MVLPARGWRPNSWLTAYGFTNEAIAQQLAMYQESISRVPQIA